MDKIIKKSRANGSITLPPSKSYAHRYIIAAALSNNESVISNVDLSDDINATLNCIKALGVNYNYDEVSKKLTIDPTKKLTLSNKFLCNESGSTLRFFIPLALINEGNYIFSGTQTLIARGIDIYEKMFTENEISFSKDDTNIYLRGRLNQNHYTIDGSISSQFITGLLFALPLLQHDSEIEIVNTLTSKPYIDITLDVLNDYGIDIKFDKNIFYIKGNQTYHANNVYVEADASNAAFIDAFNYLDGKVELFGLNDKSLQGDLIYKVLFNKLNEKFQEIDITNCIDLGPILIAFAALKHGAKFTGCSRLKIKESNRGYAMKEELEKLGAIINIDDDVIEVIKTPLFPSSKPLSSHNDHRIAMALSVCLSTIGGTITDAGCVKKSYPNFFLDLARIGVQVE